MLKWPNFNYYETVPIMISLKRPRSLIFHFVLLEFSTQDFLSRGTVEIYLYPVSSCPGSKVDIALRSKCLENIITLFQIVIFSAE